MSNNEQLSVQQYIQHLKKDVIDAENLRNTGNIDTIKNLYNKHRDQYSRFNQDKETSVTNEGHTFKAFIWIAIGMLGLTRILHTEYNQELRAATKASEKKAVEGAIQEIHEFLQINFFNNLPISKLPYVSITGDPYYHEGEIEQDFAATFIGLGLPEKAHRSLSSAISSAREKLESLKQPTSYPKYAQDASQAVSSTLAVLLRRSSQLTGSQKNMSDSLKLIVHHPENPPRQLALAKFALSLSILDWRDQANIISRIENFILGLGISTPIVIKSTMHKFSQLIQRK